MNQKKAASTEKREIFRPDFKESPPEDGKASAKPKEIFPFRPEPEPTPKPWRYWIRWAIPLIAALTVLVVAGIGICVMNHKEGLRYADGVEVSVYAFPDGHKPESMARRGNTIYFTQDGGLYCLKNETVSEISLDGWEADKVRVWEDEEPLVLTRPKLEGEAYRSTILRVYADAADAYVEDDFLSEHLIAGYENVSKDITDFAVSPDGLTLWYITRHRNATSVDNTEYTLDSCSHKADSHRYEAEEHSIIFEYMVSDENSPRMAFDEDGNLYITEPEDAFIRILRKNTRVLDTFAGQTMDMPGESEAIVGIHGQNDYGEVSFQHPTALTTSGQYLYVLDNGTVRRIPLHGVPPEGIDTLAGNVTEDAQAVSVETPATGKDALLSTDKRSDLILLDDEGKNLLLSAPEVGVAYQISTEEE